VCVNVVPIRKLIVPVIQTTVNPVIKRDMKVITAVSLEAEISDRIRKQQIERNICMGVGGY
jgi:hypothetical protein